MEQNLSRLIEQAKAYEMTPEKWAEQRISFVYGNLRTENKAITIDLVEALARRV